MATLVYYSPNGLKQAVFVNREYPTILVGRQEPCEVQAASDQVSRQHCKVRHERGRYLLEDLGSRNGTFLDDRPVEESALLEHGAEIRCGTYRLRFYLEEEERATLAGSDTSLEGDPMTSLEHALASAGAALADLKEGLLTRAPAHLSTMDVELAPGSATEVEMAASISETLPPEAEVEMVALLDLREEWGGRHVWIHRDGRAYALLLGPENGGLEGTYRLQVSGGAFRRVERAVQDKEFRSLGQPDRTSLPDEAQVSVFIKWHDGTTTARCKWAGQRLEAFDTVYSLILGTLRGALSNAVALEEAPGPTWRPAGFPSPEEIRAAIV